MTTKKGKRNSPRGPCDISKGGGCKSATCRGVFCSVAGFLLDAKRRPRGARDALGRNLKKKGKLGGEGARARGNKIHLIIENNSRHLQEENSLASTRAEAV